MDHMRGADDDAIGYDAVQYCTHNIYHNKGKLVSIV